MPMKETHRFKLEFKEANMSTGKLEAIWLKREHGGAMEAQECANVKANQGLVGNVHRGGKRQVTLIQKEVWGALGEKFNAAQDPSTRRANLMVSGVQLENSTNRVLQIGQVRIHIYGETQPCEVMDAAQQGLRAALKEHWGGGVFGAVLDDGEIAVGDPARWLE
jgi:MOSC domain-containing protein YiiM